MIKLDNENYYLFSPVIAPASENETEEQFDERWGKFDQLPEAFKEKLLVDDIPKIIESIANAHDLSLSQVIPIARNIRRYYFGEVGPNDFSDTLSREINVELEKGKQISELIFKEIINNEHLQSKSESDHDQKKETISIHISSALKQFPNLGEQLVTSSGIKLRIFPQPVRPSIKNWIEDYHQVMGAQKHGMMERGNYLFHSENTKKLSPGERRKLGEVLRSLDEDVMLKIDPDRQEVVFDESAVTSHQSLATGKKIVTDQQPLAAGNFQNQNRPLPNSLPRGEGVTSKNISTPNSQLSNQNIRFSSPHVMPSEKKNIEQEPVQRTVNPSRFPNPDAPNNFSNYRSNLAANTQAGKPWQPDSRSMNQTEPKIVGNVVDLKNL